MGISQSVSLHPMWVFKELMLPLKPKEDIIANETHLSPTLKYEAVKYLSRILTCQYALIFTFAKSCDKFCVSKIGKDENT